MSDHNCVASATAHRLANHLAKPSPSVAINIKRRTQEKNYIQRLSVHDSPTVTREAAE